MALLLILKSNEIFIILKSIRANTEEVLDEKEIALRKLRENARLEKWNKMLSNFDDFYKNNFNKLKSRTRKGVPDSIRGLIWQIYADVEKYRSKPEYANIYQELQKDDDSDIELESVILRDIDRTFPKHSLFKEKYGLG